MQTLGVMLCVLGFGFVFATCVFSVSAQWRRAHEQKTEHSAKIRVVESAPGNAWSTVEVDADRFYIRGGTWQCSPSGDPNAHDETWVQRVK